MRSIRSTTAVVLLVALSSLPAAIAQDDPQVAKTLESSSKLLRQPGRSQEAGEMDARAQAIRAKQPAVSPRK